MAQPPIDPGPPFERQIRPIFEARCIACHGPTQQKAGLRLDDRQAALKGGAGGPVIIPGKSAESRLFHMVESGRMPIDEELSVLEVGALKAWIDAGAVWPEARRAAAFAVEPKVEAFRLAVRNLDRAAVRRLTADPALVKGRNAGGQTALHYAALLGDAAQVAALLDRGADPNASDIDGVTPLMWATTNDANARLLVERGANVNAVSNGGKTPLIVAVGRADGVDLVSFLIDRGARVSPDQAGPLAVAAGSSPDLGMLKLLFPKVLDPKGPAGAQVATDATAKCYPCLDFMLQQGVRGPQLAVSLVLASNSGDAALVKRMLDLGAPVTGRGPQGATALLAAANSEIQAAEKVRLLLDAGADPNIAAPDGRTPLVYAKARHPDVAPLLVAKGAK